MAHKVVVSLAGNTPKADPDPCQICSDCAIVWVPAEEVTSFDVKFDKPEGTPFSGSTFSGGHNRPAWSGACKDRPKPGVTHKFKYTLTVNGKSIDPSVDVEGGP